jgi:hypothetical protein
MTSSAVKKKRYEGLMQFQERLRQALACIQASFPGRFSPADQSEQLKGLNTHYLSHFLLNAQSAETNETMSGSSPLLMAIEQLSDDPTDWKYPSPADDVKISAWLDSGDPLACSQMFWLLAAGLSEHPVFDLNQLFARGSVRSTLVEAMSQSWMSHERTELFDSFRQDAEQIFSAENTLVSTDGCSVSLVMQGSTSLSSEKAFEAAIKHLKSSERHLVIFSYEGGEKPRIQCAFLTPMRLPLKEPQSFALKGFVLLRDIKKTAKQDK